MESQERRNFVVETAVPKLQLCFHHEERGDVIIVTTSLQYLFIKDTSICFLTRVGIFGVNLGQLAVLILPHLMTILRLEWMRVLMGCNLIVFQCQMDPQQTTLMQQISLHP